MMARLISGYRLNYSVCRVHHSGLGMDCRLLALINSCLVYSILKHFLQTNLFCPTNLWYIDSLQTCWKLCSACNGCMLYLTVLPLGSANFVLTKKCVLASRCLNLCYYCMHCRLLALINSSLVYSILKHFLQTNLFCSTNLWYIDSLQTCWKLGSACNCCMLYLTVLPLGSANFVLTKKRVLASRRLNLCCYCHKYRRLLTRIYGVLMLELATSSQCCGALIIQTPLFRRPFVYMNSSDN